MLQIYNTLTRAKAPFTPMEEGKVGLYVCGPTVYDRAHIGNARPVVAFDVLFRLLQRHYDHVTYVRNITDVDDKINKRAAESGKDISEITAETTKMFHDDMGALNALPPTIEPRATAHIAEMIAMIARLIEKGHAYEAEGHVLFHVASMANYGKLSRRSQDEMEAGARVEVASYKKDPGDFVLWKPSEEGQPGWESPWGIGRPGWHIECSAMSAKYLGEMFDIHGGGQDLIFPHHENEIAQSCCASGHDTMARHWMHNGYVMIEGEKMSKSLGNFITVHDVLGDAPGEAIRLNLLSTHYHQPLNWTADGLKQARQTMDRFYTALKSVEDIQPADVTADSVEAALMDDLNTPKAIAEMHALASSLNKATSDAEKAELKGQLIDAGKLMGLLEQTPADWFMGGADDDGLDAAAIEAKIEERLSAKKNKDFATADQIRNDLAAQGIILEDGPGGTSWKRA